MSHVQTNAFAGALSMALHFVGQANAQKQAANLAEVQAGAARDLVQAVVSRRIDAVQAQCQQVLQLYADQARSYIDEKKAYADKILDTRDVIKRLELAKRVNDIDTQLREIRADAKLLYDRMCEVILKLGGQGLNLHGSLPGSLELPLG